MEGVQRCLVYLVRLLLLTWKFILYPINFISITNIIYAFHTMIVICWWSPEKTQPHRAGNHKKISRICSHFFNSTISIPPSQRIINNLNMAIFHINQIATLNSSYNQYINNSPYVDRDIVFKQILIFLAYFLNLSYLRGYCSKEVYHWVLLLWKHMLSYKVGHQGIPFAWLHTVQLQDWKSVEMFCYSSHNRIYYQNLIHCICKYFPL